ncbi:MAG: FliM/FliN family flagellar motor switch protein [Deltaproteobacteria bacterium]|nr:FliM/FliN family flagellar motor switch protein [Deltaproteobacteria bacterium]
MQGPLLSKEEIDMLLVGIREHGLGARKAGLPDERDIRPYDRTGLEAVDASRIAGLERINRLICRESSISLTGLLGSAVEVVCDGVEVASYRRLMAGPGKAFCAFTLTPLSGRGCLIMEPSVTGLIVDAYFGWRGTTAPSAQTRLSALSRSTLTRAADALLDAMRTSWAKELLPLISAGLGIQPINEEMRAGFEAGFASERFETSFKQMPVMPDAALVHLSYFKMTVSGCAGRFIIAIPMDSLKPVSGALANLCGAQERAVWAAGMRQAVLDTPITLSVEMGTAGISAEDLLSLRPGDIIETDRRAREPIDVLVEGRALLTAMPGAFGGRYAIRLTETKVLAGC